MKKYFLRLNLLKKHLIPLFNKQNPQACFFADKTIKQTNLLNHDGGQLDDKSDDHNQHRQHVAGKPDDRVHRFLVVTARFSTVRWRVAHPVVGLIGHLAVSDWFK